MKYKHMKTQKLHSTAIPTKWKRRKIRRRRARRALQQELRELRKMGGAE